jgi:hypothetical protein
MNTKEKRSILQLLLKIRKKLSLPEYYIQCHQNMKSQSNKNQKNQLKAKKELRHLQKANPLLMAKHLQQVRTQSNRRQASLIWEGLVKNLKNLMKMNLLKKYLINYVQRILFIRTRSQQTRKKSIKNPICIIWEMTQKSKETCSFAISENITIV